MQHGCSVLSHSSAGITDLHGCLHVTLPYAKSSRVACLLCITVPGSKVPVCSREVGVIHVQDDGTAPEPVVTPAALEAVVRPDVKGTRGCPPEARIILVNQHDRLLHLGIAGKHWAMHMPGCM